MGSEFTCYTTTGAKFFGTFAHTGTTITFTAHESTWTQDYFISGNTLTLANSADGQQLAGEYTKRDFNVPNRLIGRYRMAGEENDRYDIVITPTKFSWAEPGFYSIIVSVSSTEITHRWNQEVTTPYELNGDILRVQAGAGNWQERVRVK